MIINYLKIASRNMLRNKTQSFVGIFGLAFALACLVPAVYWMRYETTFDNFYPESKQIHRVYTFDNETGQTNDLVSGILQRKLQEHSPAMQMSTVFYSEKNDCQSERLAHIQLQMIFADSSFLTVFPQTIISGQTHNPLQITNDIIISETCAKRLFGTIENSIGKQIKSTLFGWHPPYTVTAVVKDPPQNTNVSFDAILCSDDLLNQKSFIETSVSQIWTFATLQMYVKVPFHTNIDELEMELKNLSLKFDNNSDIDLHMMPITDIRHHLKCKTSFTLNFIRLFVVSGVLLLFTAIFNFLNLHFELFRRRKREFHLRIVNGASVRQLFVQIIFELLCITVVSLIPAWFFIWVTHGLFIKLLMIQIQFSDILLLFISFGIMVLCIMLVVSMIPILRLIHDSKQAISERAITGNPLLRRIVVSMQLAVSLVFIIAALVMTMQMHFVNHKDLGFERDGIIHLSGISMFLPESIKTELKKELIAIPQIKMVTDAYIEPEHNVSSQNLISDLEWPGKESDNASVFYRLPIDSQFDEVFGIKIIDGEWPKMDEVRKVVLNEEAVRVMGLQNPVGTMIQMSLRETQNYQIVGIVQDFHMQSLRNSIYPTVFFTSSYSSNNFYARVEYGQEQEAIQRINAILPQIDPTLSDVNVFTVNEMYDQLNHSEYVGLKLFSILALICLLISLFGIYALVSAATKLRRKEIAIRKVMGANMKDIIEMFFKAYILQTFLAGIFAIPLAYVIMNDWLQEYAYRINIPFWLLASVLFGVIFVVLLTVFGQVRQAASSNPADVVKNE